MNSSAIAVVGGVRTPFARARSVYSKFAAPQLGGLVLKETVARTGVDPKKIDEVYLGLVCFPPEGTNVAREAVFDSGLPPQIPATSINRYCASSLEAAAGIAAKIQAGQINIGIAAGAESISSMQALFSREATDYFQDLMRMKTLPMKLKHLSRFKPQFLAPNAPGINEPTTGLSMGQSADLMARLFKVSRADQDQFALDSHLKAHNAWERGFFRSHVMTVGTPDGKVVDKDTDIRADSSLEKLGSLRPVFYKDGSITAGNASPLTDGASACLLMKESEARAAGFPILGIIRSYATAAVDIQKEPLLIGPVYAIPAALKQAGISWNDLDLVEMHEAFAAQALASIYAIESDTFAKEKLGLSQAIGKVDRSKFNVNGGSVPLGHPFGATGVRLILQALHELKARKKNLALLSVCAAGGLGSVMVLEAKE